MPRRACRRPRLSRGRRTSPAGRRRPPRGRVRGRRPSPLGRRRPRGCARSTCRGRASARRPRRGPRRRSTRWWHRGRTPPSCRRARRRCAARSCGCCRTSTRRRRLRARRPPSCSVLSGSRSSCRRSRAATRVLRPEPRKWSRPEAFRPILPLGTPGRMPPPPRDSSLEAAHAAAPRSETREQGNEAPRSNRALLTDRVFGWFFVTNSLSNIGNWFQNVAAGIVVYDLTGSSAAVGAVSMVQFAGTMLLTPWMGSITDRVDRQRMLLVGQTISFVSAAVLAIVVFTVGIDGLPGPWPIYAATAVIGLGAAVILPSLQAIVPALVERADLDRAIALNSMTFNIARGIGPIAAGTVIAAFGAQWAFGINAMTFVPLLLVLFLVSPRGDVAPDPEEAGSVGDGLRWIRRRPAVLATVVTTLVVGWTSDPFSTLMPALADDLGGGDATVGLLVGSFGFGAALTAPLSDQLRSFVGRTHFIAFGLTLTTAGLVGVALSPISALAMLGCAVTGSGFLVGVTGTNTELQRVLPESMRGRVMAWWSVAFLGCRPLAALVDGAVADLTDVRIAVTLAATIASVAALVLWRRGLTTEGAENPSERSEG